MVADRHRRLAEALPIGGGGPVADFGCGRGMTLRALRERVGPDVELVGVERDAKSLQADLAQDPNLRVMAGDLNAALPFTDASFEAAVCHNVLECLPDKQSFLREAARVLAPGGHLLLSHTDFDTMVFNTSDIDLTRSLVHANADTQEAWMDASDGAIGRKLVAIVRQSPLDLVDSRAWVILDTAFEQDGPAHTATRSIAATVRRDGHDDLAVRLSEWIDDLQSLAERGEFLFSVNDYAVLLRRPSAAHS